MSHHTQTDSNAPVDYVQPRNEQHPVEWRYAIAAVLTVTVFIWVVGFVFTKGVQAAGGLVNISISQVSEK